MLLAIYVGLNVLGRYGHQGPLLLTRFNFNLSMDKQSH